MGLEGLHTPIATGDIDDMFGLDDDACIYGDGESAEGSCGDFSASGGDGDVLGSMEEATMPCAMEDADEGPHHVSSAGLTAEERLDPVLDALSDLDTSELVDDFLPEGGAEASGPPGAGGALSDGALRRARDHASILQDSRKRLESQSVEDLEAASLGAVMR